MVEGGMGVEEILRHVKAAWDDEIDKVEAGVDSRDEDVEKLEASKKADIENLRQLLTPLASADGGTGMVYSN